MHGLISFQVFVSRILFTLQSITLSTLNSRLWLSCLNSRVSRILFTFSQLSSLNSQTLNFFESKTLAMRLQL
ncbi:hypothetical protein I3843_09G147900 [Carya illinoinensis]|nr:hypothetical protein I3843_09G147900 [Carya illinoinensis]